MPDEGSANERTALLTAADHRYSLLVESERQSVLSSHVSKDELALGQTSVGERLPYNDYTTIDWVHDLVKDSHRGRYLRSNKSVRGRLWTLWEDGQGWVAAAATGILTACVAFLVDISVATVSDWKKGYCSTNIFSSREFCCTERSPIRGADYRSWSTRIFRGRGLRTDVDLGEDCDAWTEWSDDWWKAFAIYVAFALLFGVISSSVTMLTKATLPHVDPAEKQNPEVKQRVEQTFQTKTMYMAAGSGIPEIKTILSGFVIPGFLSLKVLAVKAVGSVFAVSTGMCLGKEGPFVHISTCAAWLVGSLLPKYRDNGQKMRELLSAGCASGLSVAFGAPLGGVLFSLEEISTYFPRKVLWRAFLCSLCAAMLLRELNPTGTGKLVLFQSDFGTSYKLEHYAVFTLLGVAGGVFGGVFCKANFAWSQSFRKYGVIKNHPVFEVFLVVLATAVVQYPNPMTREPGDIIIKNLLVDCRRNERSWVCDMENDTDPVYVGWLVYGALAKLLLTTITFGIKVPSGIIIPALDAGAFFGRLVGQLITSISPGIFAMVGAAAFLAGVSRMTVSLAVIMFELTGELEYTVPNMIAILVAKWVADAMEGEGVYDLAQTVLGHPFLDTDQSVKIAQDAGGSVHELVPPRQTMQEITVDLPKDCTVSKSILEKKLEQLKARGLMDAGLVLVQDGMLQGYLAEAELEFGLSELGSRYGPFSRVRMLGEASEEGGEEGDAERGDQEEDFSMTMFVDRTPLTINENAPIEYAVEMFGRLGLRYLCVVENGSSKLVGVVIKKRLVKWLEEVKHGT